MELLLPMTIVPEAEITEAWTWIKNGVPTRFTEKHQEVSFVALIEWADTNGRLLHTHPDVIKHLSTLYCASQFSVDDEIENLVNSNTGFDVQVSTVTIEADVRPVIASPRRFRDSLSEHLAYWVHIALVKKSSAFTVKAKRPHIQPEDKGPDGVLVEFSDPTRIEVSSVKNSINNPRSAIATSKFRKQGIPTRGKQLDDFYLFTKGGLGITRLNDIVSSICRSASLDLKPIIKIGLNNVCFSHAVVVANHEHCSITLFDGYRHVGGDPSRRIATFIGSENWKDLAEATRQATISRLIEAGVW